MTYRPNKFKADLAAGHQQIGLWLSMADSVAAEISATAGFEWLLIDAEHGPNDLRTVLAQLQTLAAYPVEPVLRPPIAETWLLKQYLDAGARSFLIPMIENAEHAAEVIGMLRYPPHGGRGVGARMARASQFGLREDYIATAKDDVCVLLQIESVDALPHIEAIAKVPGVDGLFVGPSDLAASMGHPGNPGHSAVRAAVDDALRRIKAAGKPTGIISFNAEETTRQLDAGIGFIAVGADAAILATGTRALVQQFKTNRRK